MDRTVALALLSFVACSSSPSAGDTSEASVTSSSESDSEASETSGGPDLPDPEPQPIPCPSNPALGNAFATYSWINAGPYECTILAHETSADFEEYPLACTFEGQPFDSELRFAVDAANRPAAFPFEIGQTIQITTRDGEWDNALSVRDPDTQRLLLFDYWGPELPHEDIVSLPEEFYTPLSLAIADTLCITECEESGPIPLPDGCHCERKLDLEVRGGPGAEPTLIRHSSGDYVQIPGEPDGYFGANSAYACEDSPDPSGDPLRRFMLLYVAGV